MKKYWCVSLSVIIIAVLGFGYYSNDMLSDKQSARFSHEISQNSFAVLPEGKIGITQVLNLEEKDVLSNEKSTKIDAKKIKTTEDLHRAFPKFYLYAVSPVFIERFPSDFSEKGDVNLFVKAMLPLILREQKNILSDREFLIDLNQKDRLSWTEVEQARFETLLTEYELTKEKLSVSQMDELLKRVDVIPVSLALAASGVYTDWGRKNLNAPFGQKEWVSGQYADKEFHILGEAVQSYMKELNTLAIYGPMRTARQTYRTSNGVLGEKLISHVDNYMRENPSYTHQIKEAFKTMKLGVLDEARLFE